MALFVYTIVIVAGILADQITKYLCVIDLPIDRSADVKIWEGVLHLRCISNDGAAFGMLDDKRWIFMTVSVVMIIVISVLLILKHRSMSSLLNIALCLVVSGGIGNMIDRVALGYVVDFIYFVPIDFPCFNVADSLVCIGSVLMFVSVLFFDGFDFEKFEAKKSAVAETPTVKEAQEDPPTPDICEAEEKENDE